MAFSLDALLNCRNRWVKGSLVGLLVLVGGQIALAQDHKGGGPPARGAAEKGQAGRPGSPPAGDNDLPTAELSIEKLQWPEPQRFELLRNEFKELPSVVLLDRERGAIMEMARGQGSIDTSLIKKYVASNAAELTRHANIAAMLDEGAATSRNQRAMDEATSRLMQPLFEPVSTTNATFRREYVKALIDQSRELLKGHLLTRTLYMVVLSRAGSDDLVPIFIAQLRDPEQTYMVKLLSAVGLTNVAQNGRRPPEANTKAIPGAQAVADFLQVAPPDAPWPLICRNLEALAALRQSTQNPAGGKAELADSAFLYLARKDVEPDVRIWAGWALSRLQYPSSVRDINYDLVAYLLGQVALEIGDAASKVPLSGDNLQRNQRMVAKAGDDLLRVLEALTGSSEIRGSGLRPLSHESPLVSGLEQRIRTVVTNTLQLTQAAGSQVQPSRKTLAESVEALRSFLDNNEPRSRVFYTGGPELKETEPADEAATTTNGEQ